MAHTQVKTFEGFHTERIKTSGAEIHARIGGGGPPLLLLHGFPQTHMMWHKIAPALAEDFTVVATDLRGYGDSNKPADGENHANHSKRATAVDQIEVMRHLGFEKFAIAGHDRGGRVTHRMLLDHPERVTRAAVLDIVPTHKLFRTSTSDFATVYYHWYFLIQAAPFPETLIANSLDTFLMKLFKRLMPHAVTPEAYAEYERCFRDPATVHAACEDYRAAASIDLAHDDADLDRKIKCPLLVLWGGRAPMHRLYDVLDTWRERASDVRGKPLPCGHYLPEEAPEETLAELRAFFKLA